MSDRLINADGRPEETNFEVGLRPKSLNEYIGQTKAKRNLKVFIDAARNRQEAVTMFYSSARPAWGKQPSPTLLLRRWASISKAPPVR